MFLRALEGLARQFSLLTIFLFLITVLEISYGMVLGYVTLIKIAWLGFLIVSALCSARLLIRPNLWLFTIETVAIIYLADTSIQNWAGLAERMGPEAEVFAANLLSGEPTLKFSVGWILFQICRALAISKLGGMNEKRQP